MSKSPTLSDEPPLIVVRPYQVNKFGDASFAAIAAGKKACCITRSARCHTLTEGVPYKDDRTAYIEPPAGLVQGSD